MPSPSDGGPLQTRNSPEKKLGYAPVPDANFAKDVQAAIDAHREPLNSPAWD